MLIAVDDPRRPDIRALLDEHLADMFATSPAESVHALDHDALAHPSVTFYSARENGELLGCAALARRERDDAVELKSMRTTATARGRGVASALLDHLVDAARSQGFRAIRLETGTEDYFGAARRLYLRHGFTPRAPFADYTLDPHSAYFELVLDRTPA